jgi:hypothetical protein
MSKEGSGRGLAKRGVEWVDNQSAGVTHHMMNSNDRFVQSCCKCLCCIHSDTQTAWHTRASCESNAIDVLYKIDIGFLQSATNCIGLGMGVKTRGLKK